MSSLNLTPRSPELRLGREFAVRALYAVDINASTAQLTWDRCRRAFLDEEYPQLADPDDVTAKGAEAVALYFLAGVRARLTEVDEVLQRSSKRWKPSRMPVVDRNILRLAAFELLDARVPPKETIYDAVELAKKYGDAPSSRFVNGILDQLCRDNDIKL